MNRALIRLAARLLPAARRARYTEEWLADLAGATTLGLSPAGVTLGAWCAAARLAWASPGRKAVMIPVGPLAAAVKLTGASRRRAAALSAMSLLTLLAGVGVLLIR
ncbi:hypothetical protein [Longispora albida]|uniref:hypothetical protein n=1 Tax=Longispora albida TaxID=203523 RepID=UPI0003616265|nr:hypothetical protein [Longispora albida]